MLHLSSECKSSKDADYSPGRMNAGKKREDVQRKGRFCVLEVEKKQIRVRSEKGAALKVCTTAAVIQPFLHLYEKFDSYNDK